MYVAYIKLDMSYISLMHCYSSLYSELISVLNYLISVSFLPYFTFLSLERISSSGAPQGAFPASKKYPDDATVTPLKFV